MNEHRALATAPLAVWPVAFAFIMLRSLIIGDWRELFAAPYSAMMIAVAGYPFAVVAGWLLWHALVRLALTSFTAVLAAAAVSAEAIFWLVISPFWEREFSAAFCVALVGTCGLACGGMFFWLIRPKAPH
ncbi:MAG TPA: hypothetical protein VIF10_15845 [Methylobacter sp.]|jgi:hypothetical protein